jgi:hypothetical protein
VFLDTQKPQGIPCHFIPNEISWRELSNGVNHSSNGAFMRKLQGKQWKVDFKTQLTLKGHKFLIWNHIEAQEQSIKRY